MAQAAVRLMIADFFQGVIHDRKLMREAHVNIAIPCYLISIDSLDNIEAVSISIFFDKFLSAKCHHIQGLLGQKTSAFLGEESTFSENFARNSLLNPDDTGSWLNVISYIARCYDLGSFLCSAGHKKY